MEKLIPAPPWFDILNAMQEEWRETKIEQGRDPDPYIERLLCDAGKWPPSRRPASIRPN